MSHRALLIASAAAAAVFVVGCANTPSPSSPSSVGVNVAASNVAQAATGPASPPTSGQPEYEHAYYNGAIVTMNHISVPQNPHALAHAAADLYAVFYPANHALWLPGVFPLCNPCDHPGAAGDPRNFHDHVLDSIPGDPGHGEFNALWHVFAIMPLNASQIGAYALRLPMISEAEVNAAITAGVAREVDTGSYFLCSIVNPHAAK
jgi:hypothetical protein